MNRPVVAIITNVQTPYRVAMHRRLIREIPEVQFYSVYTHDKADQNWSAKEDADTNPVHFGAGDSSDEQVSFGAQGREFAKGGKLIEWMKSVGVNAIIVGGYSDLGRIRTMLYSKMHGIPVFLLSDSNIHSERFGGWRKLLKKVFLTSLSGVFDKVLVGGENGMRFYRQYGISESQFLRFGIEVDYGQIESIRDEQIAQARAKYDLPAHRKRIVFCGRMEQVKRPDLMLRSFLAIADDRPDWDLVMIGAGSLLDSLRNSIPPHLTDRVRWLGFIDDPHIIFSVYRACDALALSSGREPWGLVVNEAAASGLAIVSADRVGAVPELVKPGLNGMLFETGNLESLTQALREITEPGVSERMGVESKRVLAEYRNTTDPVRAMRAALRSSGKLPVEGGKANPILQ